MWKTGVGTKDPAQVKVKYKVAVPALLLLLLASSTASQPKCDKTPSNQGWRSSGDAGFRISIPGSPRLYRPKQQYDLFLFGTEQDPSGNVMDPIRKSFIDFVIVAESDLPATEIPSLGVFQIKPLDAMTKFSHKCSHAVEATSALNKEEVSVLWTAPEQGSGCIELKAMVVERKDKWHMDEGTLSYVICEDQSPISTSPTVEPCCACDEAKYEVIFEGLWSRHTHPKDFPKDEWQTQFSHMIGASHSINYDLWKYGEMATSSLTMLAEQGRTRKLEIDMKRSSRNIRSVIKARGLHQRSNIIGRTFAVFRTDKQNHLLSLVTKMIPSPDWIVGLSMENLCLANCSWVDGRVIDLYPWDAGSKSGLTYQQQGHETRPRETIHRITSCNPEDPASPFYDQTCAPIKPVARIHILKQREYKKQCVAGQGGQPPLNPSWSLPGDPQQNQIFNGAGIGPQVNSGDGSEYDYGEAQQEDGQYGQQEDGQYDSCQTSDWTRWTQCSSSCGSGSQSKDRHYLNSYSAQQAGCRVELFEKRTCRDLPPCDSRSYVEQRTFEPFSFNGDDMSGYVSPWNNKRLESGNLKKAPELLESEPESFSGRSYSYGGGVSYSPRTGSQASYVEPNVVVSNSEQALLAGYAKQKGYPPARNPPGSIKYNPYRSSGYYGYTYGGPSQQSYSGYDSDGIYQGDHGDVSSNCQVTEWGDWSHCSASCGSGVKTRSRRYMEIDFASCTEDLSESVQCDNDCDSQGSQPTLSPQGRQPTFSPQVLRQGQGIPKKCQVANWSQWSPCSRTCGDGYQIRTRLYLIPFAPDRTSCNIRLLGKQSCSMPNCPYGDSFDYSNMLDQIDYEDSMEQLADQYVEVAEDPYVEPIFHEVYQVKEPRQPFCLDEPDTGPCSAKVDRWYYNSTLESCHQFTYSYCAGNSNNFPNQEDCMRNCSTSAMYMLQAKALTREDYLNPPRTNCQVSDWSDWSSCSATCGKGWVTRTRSILSQPQNGGKKCPRKLSKRKKCRMMKCGEDHQNWYQGNYRMLQQQSREQRDKEMMA